MLVAKVSSPTNWKPIGTVVGNTSINEFAFILKSFQSRVGDIVCVKMDIPDSTYTKTQTVHVWGRILSIERYNPFFPYEAAQELGDSGLSIEDTVLSTSRDQLQATVLVLGYTLPSDPTYALHALTYPVQPAATVLYPPADDVSRLLQGPATGGPQILIGELFGRSDVKVTLRANPVVARHMAILAMTGGGKTVAARRIIRGLIDVGYPLLILDPHGDYLGLAQKQHLFPKTKVKVFYPNITVTEETSFVINTLIGKMTAGLSDPQRELMDDLLVATKTETDEGILSYLERLIKQVDNVGTRTGKRESTQNAVKRALNLVRNKIADMEVANERLRATLKKYPFEPLPDPITDPAAIIQPNQVSILYLGGYDHLTQSTVVSILMDSLFNHRASMSNRIPPFLAVIEEAHNFIPSGGEGQAETPSLESIRRVITEGRKFGTGLLLISQRPSRLDQTILSQCNSFLILRLVNPRDQQFVRQVMENLSESDARMLPGFGPGYGIVSGQAVRFPLMVKVHMDEDLIVEEIGQENFVEQAQAWSQTPTGQTAIKSTERARLMAQTNRRAKRKKTR